MEKNIFDNLKMLLVEDIEDCIVNLMDIARNGHKNEFDELIQLQAKLLHTYKSQRQGLLSNQELDLNLSKIRKSLLDVINILESKNRNKVTVDSSLPEQANTLHNRLEKISKKQVIIFACILLAVLLLYLIVNKNKWEAEKVTNSFINAGQERDTSKMREIFPKIANYKIFPEMNGLKIENTKVIDDSIVVTTSIKYANGDVKKVFFCYKKDTHGNINLVNTKGLLRYYYSSESISTDMLSKFEGNIKLALDARCIETGDQSDIQIVDVSNRIDSFIVKTEYLYNYKIYEFLKVTDYTWYENQWSGNITFKGLVLNNFDFPIPVITLQFSFFDNKEKLLVTYKEKVFDIPANEGKAFDFTFSNAGKSKGATAYLEFNDELLRTYLLNSDELKKVGCDSLKI